MDDKIIDEMNNHVTVREKNRMATKGFGRIYYRSEEHAGRAIHDWPE